MMNRRQFMTGTAVAIGAAVLGVPALAQVDTDLAHLRADPRYVVYTMSEMRNICHQHSVIFRSSYEDDWSAFSQFYGQFIRRKKIKTGRKFILVTEPNDYFRKTIPHIPQILHYHSDVIVRIDKHENIVAILKDRNGDIRNSIV